MGKCSTNLKRIMSQDVDTAPAWAKIDRLSGFNRDCRRLGPAGLLTVPPRGHHLVQIVATTEFAGSALEKTAVGRVESRRGVVPVGFIDRNGMPTRSRNARTMPLSRSYPTYCFSGPSIFLTSP